MKIPASSVYSALSQIANERVSPNQNTSVNSAAGLVSTFAHHLRQSEQIAMSNMAGGASSHDLATALAQSQLSIEAATSVRNKVVESYQEILRMPI